MPKVEILYNGVLEGHKDAVYALVSGNKPNEFFSAGGDGMIIHWDLAHKGVGQVVAQLPSAIYALLYFAETNTIMAGTRFGGLYFLDLESHAQKAVINLKHDVFDLCYIRRKKWIAAACAGGYIYFLDAKTLETVHQFHPTDASCRTLALSPNQKHLASGWSDGKIRVYDLAADFMEIKGFTAHLPSVFSLAYGIKGSKLVSGGRDAQIRIWDTLSLYIETQKVPAHLFTVNALVLIPEYGLMASASRDKTVKVWDAANFDLLKVIDKTKLPAHSHSVNKLLWTGFDKNLISADDKLIRVWGIIRG